MTMVVCCWLGFYSTFAKIHNFHKNTVSEPCYKCWNKLSHWTVARPRRCRRLRSIAINFDFGLQTLPPSRCIALTLSVIYFGVFFGVCALDDAGTHGETLRLGWRTALCVGDMEQDQPGGHRADDHIGYWNPKTLHYPTNRTSGDLAPTPRYEFAATIQKNNFWLRCCDDFPTDNSKKQEQNTMTVEIRF